MVHEKSRGCENWRGKMAFSSWNFLVYVRFIRQKVDPVVFKVPNLGMACFNVSSNCLKTSHYS